MTTACKSCGAAIAWVKLPSGKSMPVDALAVPMVHVRQVDGEQHGRVVRVHTSHFATCPQADKHRKGKS